MKKAAIVILVSALWGVAACSATGQAPPEPQTEVSEVTVSTPPDSPTASPAPSENPDKNFKSAVEFTELVHSFEYTDAGKLAKPESPAARYLAHQTLADKAYQIAGFPSEGQVPDIKADAKNRTIKINFEAVEGESEAFSYTWKDFEYEGGKITGWTGATGPVEKVLWTRETRDEDQGRKAVLKSAYLSNNKRMTAVVELSSNVPTSFSDSDYAAKDGYRQPASDQHANDLDKGEKTLAYFIFEKSSFGGTLHIPYYDEDGTSGGDDNDWELELGIK